MAKPGRRYVTWQYQKSRISNHILHTFNRFLQSQEVSKKSDSIVLWNLLGFYYIFSSIKTQTDNDSWWFVLRSARTALTFETGLWREDALIFCCLVWAPLNWVERARNWHGRVIASVLIHCEQWSFIRTLQWFSPSHWIKLMRPCSMLDSISPLYHSTITNNHGYQHLPPKRHHRATRGVN